MALKLPVALFDTQITSTISTTETTIPILSVTTKDGTALTNGNQYGFIIDEGKPLLEEFIIGTVDTANLRLTSCLRGVSVVDGATEISGLKKKHKRNATIKVTDHPYLVSAIRVLNGTDEAGGVIKNPSSRTISDPRHLIDKEFADALTVSGFMDFVVTDAGGLDINIAAGTLVTSDGTIEYAGDSGITLTDNATNYVELTNLGAYAVNTSGWTLGYLPLAKVVTASSDISSIALSRGVLSSATPDRNVTTDYALGDTIAAGDLLYLDTAAAKWKLADASSLSTCDGKLGVALDAGVDTDTGKRVQTGGFATGLTGLTAGWVYVSDTAGDFASSAGTVKRVVGYAPNTTTLVFIDVTAIEQITGGNTALTTAVLNEMATFFANTDFTAAEAEVLTGGPSSNADDEHTHAFPTQSLNLTISHGNANASGDGIVGYADDANSGRDTFAVGYNPNLSSGSRKADSIGYDIPGGLGLQALTKSMAGAGTTMTSLNGIVKIGSDVWTNSSSSSAIDKNTTGAAFSGTARYGPMSYDTDNDRVLILYSTTAIARFSGASTTTLTNTNSDITLDTAVTATCGFIWDDTNDQIICLDLANNLLRRFNSSGTTIDTVAYTFDDTNIRGLCVIKGRVYAINVFFLFGDGSTVYSIAVDFVATDMTIN